MSAAPNHRCGRPWRTARERMFELYGHVCWICGHDGADEADHLVPLRDDPTQPVDPLTMRPSHGTSCRCPRCPPARNGRARACNQERGAGPAHTPPLVTSCDW
jgi:hypothetical protein